jgi:hypothetical protein
MFLFLCTALSLAAESDFENTEDAGQEFDEPESSLTAEVGGALAGGNASYFVLNGAISGSHKVKRNKFGANFSANYGLATPDANGDGRLDDGERDSGRTENVKRIAGDARYDHFVGKKDSLYVLAGAFHDPFAGYDLRSNQQLGYSRILVGNETTTLNAELGMDFAQENYVELSEQDNQLILAARIGVAFTHSFNEYVAFSNSVEAFENVLDARDLRVNNTAALTTKLSDAFSVKLSHSLRFDNVPVDGFATLDHLAMVTIVASVL